MSKKYTFEDWKSGKPIEPTETSKNINDFYRGIASDGLMEYEELHKIQEKQRWVYEKAIEINKKASIRQLKSELLRTDFPESYLEKEISKVNAELGEYPFVKDRVLDGTDDYYNMRGGDLKEVEDVLEGKRNQFYQIYCQTYEDGKWVSNEYLMVTSLLHYQKFLNSFDLKSFLQKKQKSDQTLTTGKKGAPVKGLSYEEAFELFEKFQSEKPRSFVYKEDGSYNRYQFIKYLAKYVDKNKIDLSDSSIERRAKKAIEKKMGL
jgi:hypothetical protein